MVCADQNRLQDKALGSPFFSLATVFSSLAHAVLIDSRSAQFLACCVAILTECVAFFHSSLPRREGSVTHVCATFLRAKTTLGNMLLRGA